MTIPKGIGGHGEDGRGGYSDGSGGFSGGNGLLNGSHTNLGSSSQLHGGHEAGEEGGGKFGGRHSSSKVSLLSVEHQIGPASLLYCCVIFNAF